MMMHRTVSRTASLVGLLALALVMVVVFGHSALVSAQPSQTITLVSGNGPLGTQDPVNEASTDGGITWQPAWIVTPHPSYHIIPGTQYISCGQTIFSCGAGYLQVTNFRATFALPPGYTNPSLTIEVHADNVATIFLNGTQIGQQTDAEIASNFQDPAESFSTSDASLFQQGTNTLWIDLKNYCCPAGLDYKAVITFDLGPIEVPIDIKPGSDPNSINTNSNGTIPVAILSTGDFDAPNVVDKTSLTFGQTGEEPSLSRCTKSAEDVNDDGLPDVVCHFNTRDTGFQVDDTEGILKGLTVDGVPIEGRDAVRIVR